MIKVALIIRTLSLPFHINIKSLLRLSAVFLFILLHSPNSIVMPVINTATYVVYLIRKRFVSTLTNFPLPEQSTKINGLAEITTEPKSSEIR